MCVIIYSKIGTEINENELKEAWETNPDGGGYAIIENGKVYYKKGFMKFNEFLREFKKYNNKNYEKIVHFSITITTGHDCNLIFHFCKPYLFQERIEVIH